MKNTKIVLSLLTLLCAFVACVPTPAKETVVQKKQTQMLEDAKKKPSGTDLDTFDITPLNQLWENERNETVSICLKGNVVLPSAKAVPIAYVERGCFTNSDLERLQSVLTADAKPLPDGILPKQYYRTQIDKLLLMKQQHIFDKYNSEDEINQAILQLTAKMNQAPESINLSEAVFSFQKSIDGAETAEQLYLQNDMTVSSLIVMNEQEGNGGGYAEYLRNVMDRAAFSELTAQGLSITLNFERTLLPNYKKPQITISEAKEKAETVVKKLGLDTFSCSGERMVALIDPTAVTPNAEIYGLYEFMFTRNVSGCNITYTNDDISADPNNEAVYRKPWRYEKVRVFIDDKGIFALLWNAPYDVREVICTRATLLPADQVFDSFCQMSVLKYSTSTLKEHGKIVIEISEIRLGLTRILLENSDNGAYLVPTWDFFGTIQIVGSDFILGKDGYQSIMTINAIDGSIIDRNAGY